MIPFSLAELAAAMAGRLSGGANPAAPVTGPVVIDSREVVPGAVFVALPGEHVDGHDFARTAHQAGAVVTIATREVGVPALLVDDPVQALGLLARALLDRLPAVRVVGITGSSGKTSTKDLVAGLLERLGPTVAPPGSLNNELGVPLTVLRATEDTRFLVLEMGARGRGHIDYLCRIAPPTVGVVVGVGTAHLGEFGSREAIAEAKAELVRALPPGGLAVLNADDEVVAAMAAQTPARAVLAGRDMRAGVRVTDLELDDQARPRFTLHADGDRVPVALALHGDHHAANAALAAAVALDAGMSPAEVARVLGEQVPRSRWRMEVRTRADGLTVVNDAYNANPDSTRSAVRTLVAMAGSGGTARRSWAVLGEMRELGADSVHEHEEIGRLTAAAGVDRVIAVGEPTRPLALAAGERAVWVADPREATAFLTDRVGAGDVVLLKASRAVGLERVAEDLLTAGAGAGTGAGAGVGVVAGAGTAGRGSGGTR